ncbi:PKD domain-containing protein [Natronomonas salina]|uniref:PKD domain-containing protein n=1 Tax=Natronomonas salina TaxID=1710540 RepID=UPI0015B753D6|nr:PKD domain-containing protein [Natronomonas salina]QLD88701.1 PKD domain-containing protein [Natronomonas salina]
MVVLSLLSVGLVAFAPTAAAQESDTYVVEQGDQCVEVDPITNRDQTVEEFYDYRSPYTEPTANDYSSHGTIEYQEHNTSVLMIYEGAEGTSLVVVHERLTQDGDERDTRGSSATFTVTGIDPGDSWAVEDDDYDEYADQDDEYVHSENSSEITWLWGQGRTDGGAYRGLADDAPVRIEPAFNDRANERYGGSPEYSGWVHDWKVVRSADPTDKEALGSMEQQVTIRAGTCGPDDPAKPNASLSAPENATTGDEITFDASDSEGDVDRYEWDFGDGTTIEDGSPTETHTYDTPRNYEVQVTAYDSSGGYSQATRTVNVTDPGPAGPTAWLSAPDTAATGDSVTLDASDSASNGSPEYGWTVEGSHEGTTEEATREIVFEEPGTYELGVTVTDEYGQDEATTTIEVVADSGGDGDAPLEASVTASEQTVEPGDEVTFDASDSEGDVDSYGWDFGDGTTVEDGSPTETHTFDSPGEYEVTLTVDGADGGTASETVTVIVEEPEQDRGAGDPGGGDSGTSDDSQESDDSDGSGSDSGTSDEDSKGSDGDTDQTTDEPAVSVGTPEGTDGDPERSATETDTPSETANGTDTGANETDSETSETDDDPGVVGDGAGFGPVTALLAAAGAVLLVRRRSE